MVFNSYMHVYREDVTITEKSILYLYKSAFDLTDVYGGIQALANVKHNVRAKNLKIISNQNSKLKTRWLFKSERVSFSLDGHKNYILKMKNFVWMH